jgi:hypothetical protein
MGLTYGLVQFGLIENLNDRLLLLPRGGVHLEVATNEKFASHFPSRVKRYRGWMEREREPDTSLC